MSEQSEHNPPQMDEQKILDQIINKIGSEKPNLVKAIRLCAIPHWFNKGILAWLQGKVREPSEQPEAILYELKKNKLAFDRNLDDQSYILHEDVRNLLLHRWRHEDAERFRELSGKTATYCAKMLRSKKLSEEQRAEWEREEMYHLLVADKERGIDRFINLSNRAIDSYRLSTLDLLLSMAGEQVDDSVGIQLWIQFFEGKKDLVSGHWEKAREIWERLRGKREEVGVELEKTLAVHLSILYKDRGEWDKAIECFQDSLEIFERAGDEQGTITILNNRGFLYKDKEEWKKAEDDFQRSLEISEKLDDKHAMARSLKNLGLLYKDHGEWDKAIKCLEDSLKNFKRMKDKRGMAITYNDLGFLYKDNGEWNKAIECFENSLKNLEGTHAEQEKAAVFNSLGFLYTNKQEWEKAEENFRNAHKILEKIGDERRMADNFSYLGFLYRDKKEWAKAEEHFKNALTLLENLSDERGKAAALHNLGLLYRHKGEREKAVDYFQQSLEIVKNVGDEMNAATTMYEFALLCEEMQQYGKASELLEKVVYISEKVGHPDLRVRKSKEILERVKAKSTSSESASGQ